jgi:hypothetical protein
MKPQKADVIQLRLRNQQLVRPAFDKPADLVRWFGAVQGQEYDPALWAIGARTRAARQTDIEQSIARGEIVRTWPMRNTLHFVTASDIHWMLELLAPRMIAASGARHRELELDARIFAQAEKVIVPALRGGQQLTRPMIYQALGNVGINTKTPRGLHILSHLSLRRLLCFGPRAGKHATFVLLDEWVPNAKSLARDAALAELALRYFQSHGPATVQDFSWWSGLTMGDARAGIEALQPKLVSETFDGKTHWLVGSASRRRGATPQRERAHLLPEFDEYTVAYRDRSSVLDPKYAKRVNAGGGVFQPIVVVDGRVVGTWKRATSKTGMSITIAPFGRLTSQHRHLVETAAARYGSFVGRSARPTITRLKSST